MRPLASGEGTLLPRNSSCATKAARDGTTRFMSKDSAFASLTETNLLRSSRSRTSSAGSGMGQSGSEAEAARPSYWAWLRSSEDITAEMWCTRCENPVFFSHFSRS
eukprot:Lithocolla_globosa_v1_NODE_1657_length_2415_cov_8.404661.p2 type:complete len:106 gc:universal NODE_1657_length_2415_cov_8.404661:1309-992(-)